ncbi:MAG: hypothetical protein KatS3mg077_2788 [Candidatus Binatia bacterium]|nr:MAG: hypothetical protein KatS3mg077_2788 [Candidatus Binatia bacterium]
MSWDFAVVGFLVLASLRGFWRGMFRELGSLAGCLAGVTVAWRIAQPVAEQLRAGVPGAASEFDAALVFLGVFVGFWVAGGVLGWAFEKLVRSPIALWLSGLGGLLLGSLKGAAIAGACLVFAQLFVPQAASQLDQSPVAGWLTRTTAVAAMWLVQSSLEPR